MQSRVRSRVGTNGVRYYGMEDEESEDHMDTNYRPNQRLDSRSWPVRN
jgi:hypothetical protein